MKKTYIVQNRRGEFYAAMRCNPWVSEYPDAFQFTSLSEAYKVRDSFTPLMARVVVNYGMATERTA